MGQEQDIKNLVDQFQKQQHMMQPNIDIHVGIDNQGDAVSTTPITPGMLQPAKGPDPVPVGNVCPQCNMVHPPLKPGETCPNAKVILNTEASNKEARDIDINKYVVALRNILVSQINQKKIKNIEKLFQNITLEVTKFLEGYNE